MKDFCRFLELDTSIHQLRCVAGINFVSVGQNRELCRVCPLAELGDIPLCPNADVYIYLRRGAAETAEVEVKFACLVKESNVATKFCAKENRECWNRSISACWAEPGARQTDPSHDGASN